MAKVKKQEVKKTDAAAQSVAALKQQIHTLSLQHAKGQLKNTTQLRVLRDKIARLLTQKRIAEFMKKEEQK